MILQQQKCSQCLQQFNSISNPPRQMPTCPHNICTKCLIEAIQQKQQFIDCGFCGKKIQKKQIKLFAQNMKIVDKIKSRPTSQYNPRLYNQHNISAIYQKEKQYLKQDDQLLISNQLQLQRFGQNFQICKVHNKPLQIICATDKTRICSHCAIFGNHKDHKFKTVLQFQDQIKKKTLIFAQILKKKQIIQQNQNLKNIHSNIYLKLKLRKQLIAKQIDKTFNQIFKNIMDAQKVVEKQLQQKFQQIKLKIDETLQNQFKIKKNFENWEKQCQQTIQRLKQRPYNFKNRVELYYLSSLEICQQGQTFLKKMNSSLKDLLKYSEQQINSISIQTNEPKFYSNIVRLVVPILDQSSYISKQLMKLQQSIIQNDFLNLNVPLINQMSNSMIVSSHNNSNIFNFTDSSIIFDQDLSSIRYLNESKEKNIKTKKKTPKNFNNNSINRTLNSLTSFNNQSIINSVSPNKIKSFNSHPDFLEMQRQKEKQKKQKQKRQSNLLRMKSNQRLFKSPNTVSTRPNLSRLLSNSPNLKSEIQNRPSKTVSQIINEIRSNDFINQVDLTQQNLSNDQIVHLFQSVPKLRQLKAVKIQKNHLNDSGLQKICQYMKNISNLNLSHNQLTQKCFDILLNNKEYLYKMRIINLSHNNIFYDKCDKKIKDKLDQFKKMQIIITL